VFNLVGFTGKYVGGTHRSGNPFSSEAVSQLLLSRRKQAVACGVVSKHARGFAHLDNVNLEKETRDSRDFWWCYRHEIQLSGHVPPPYGTRLSDEEQHMAFAASATKRSMPPVATLLFTTLPWAGLRNGEASALTRAQLYFHGRDTPRKTLEIMRIRSKTHTDGNLRPTIISHSGCGRNCPGLSVPLEQRPLRDQGFCIVCIVSESSACVGCIAIACTR